MYVPQEIAAMGVARERESSFKKLIHAPRNAEFGRTNAQPIFVGVGLIRMNGQIEVGCAQKVQTLETAAAMLMTMVVTFVSVLSEKRERKKERGQQQPHVLTPVFRCALLKSAQADVFEIQKLRGARALSGGPDGVATRIHDESIAIVEKKVRVLAMGFVVVEIQIETNVIARKQRLQRRDVRPIFGSTLSLDANLDVGGRTREIERESARPIRLCLPHETNA